MTWRTFDVSPFPNLKSWISPCLSATSHYIVMHSKTSSAGAERSDGPHKEGPRRDGPNDFMFVNNLIQRDLSISILFVFIFLFLLVMLQYPTVTPFNDYFLLCCFHVVFNPLEKCRKPLNINICSWHVHLFGGQFLHDSGGVSMFQWQWMFLSFPLYVHWRVCSNKGENTW